MQICRLHYQRQANHIHAGNHKPHQHQQQYLSGSHHDGCLTMAHMPSFVFTETHALLQKTDGVGDCEPQAVVMSA